MVIGSTPFRYQDAAYVWMTVLSTLSLVFGWAPISVSLTNVYVERRSTPKGCTDCHAKADLAGLCAIMLLMISSGGLFPCNQRAVRSAKN